jgi:photoactive yellow protein
MDDRVPDLSRDELNRYPVGVITLARDGTIVHYNRAESAFSRLKPHDVIGRRFFGDVAPCASVRGFQGRFEEFAALRGDGAERFDFAFDFAWGRHDVTITMLRRAQREDITLLVKTRSAARRREPQPRAGELARGPGGPEALTASALFGQWVEEGDGRTWWSPEVRVMFGLAESVAPRLGALHAHVLPEDRTRIEHALAEAGASEQPITLAYRIRTAQGDERSVVEHVATLSDGGARRRFGTILDVTERERHERRLWRSAHHDVLTGLPNRKLVLERLSETLLRDEPVALLFLDLDRFKHVNDTAGHAVGDALLRLVASRLASCVRPGDTVARLNGDEFLILLPGVAQAGDAEAVAESVLDAVAQPYVIDDEQHFVTVSIGLALAPHDAREADELLQAADIAMYHSKERGANAYLRYDERIRRQAGEEALREIELRRAIDHDEFVLFFQPIVDAASERIVKTEALVRWNHPERGIVSPADFIPLAERTGLIVPLGQLVLEAACARVKAWDEAGLPPIVVAVNISPLQFKDRRFAQTVGETIRRYGIAPERLELELTESVVESFEDTMESLLDLKLLGVRLSIDDFGTGYSALAYLKYFPIDTLKLDRAFVSGIGNHPLDGAIAATIVRLATDLNLQCVAEGVETGVQRDALRAIGATHLQGYLFSRPLDAEAFAARLTSSVQV